MIGKNGKSVGNLREMMRVGYPSTIEEFDLMLDAQVKGDLDQ
jgi:hypothetical protein